MDAARVEDEHHHGLGLKGPQVPAVAALVWQTDEDQPACFIGMPVIHLTTLGHQGFVERPEQRQQSLEAVGERAGRQVQTVTGQVGEQPLRGSAEGKLVQQYRDPDGHAPLTFGEEFGGTRCSDEAGLAAARAGGAIAAPAITAAVGADFDLEEFAVGSAGKRRERLAALRTLLLVGGQFQFLEDDG